MKSRGKKSRSLFFGLWPIFRKEVIHIIRDAWTMYFIIGITVSHLMIIGFGVNARVRQIKTVIYDMANTQESRDLIQRFVNTDDFNVVRRINSDKDLYDCLVSGEARVAIKIPANYSHELINGGSSDILVLVDGSNAVVTTEVINVTNGLTLKESLKRVNGGGTGGPSIEPHQSVLFNPDTLTPHFNIPGVVPFEMELIITFLVATSIVRERERGTLEQLFMTPIRPLGMMIGKMLPYAIVGLLIESEMFLLAYFVFDLPIHGNYFLLIALTVPFLVMILGIGLMISIKVNSISEAVQIVVGSTFLSIYMSGYFFEIDSMPPGFQWAAELLPTTHFIRITRGILLRGAGFEFLWRDALILLVMGAMLILLAARVFQRKQI